jgi:hypothetical protein
VVAVGPRIWTDAFEATEGTKAEAVPKKARRIGNTLIFGFYDEDAYTLLWVEMPKTYLLEKMRWRQVSRTK